MCFAPRAPSHRTCKRAHRHGRECCTHDPASARGSADAVRERDAYEQRVVVVQHSLMEMVRDEAGSLKEQMKARPVLLHQAQQLP